MFSDFFFKEYEKEYKKEKTLGHVEKGVLGKTILAKKKQGNDLIKEGTLVVIKHIELSRNREKAKNELANIRLEAARLKKLVHPFIVRYLDEHESGKQDSRFPENFGSIMPIYEKLKNETETTKKEPLPWYVQNETPSKSPIKRTNTLPVKPNYKEHNFAQRMASSPNLFLMQEYSTDQEHIQYKLSEIERRKQQFQKECENHIQKGNELTREKQELEQKLAELTKRVDDWNDSQKKLNDENRRLIEQETELKRSLHEEKKPQKLENYHRDLGKDLTRMLRRQISMNDQYYKVDFIPERKYIEMSEEELRELGDSSYDLDVITQVTIELDIRNSSSKNGVRYLKFVDGRINDQIDVIHQTMTWVEPEKSLYKTTGNLPENAVKISEDEFNQAAYNK
ncbi:Oidioi.mRNA.OKI2018_I69.chr1.g2332.t1.cds [Oikopleura dioica]|uniref:Oidioi.mRNA.OKI2018_I69.chr1.g2332.t1.cds n=1 Tax=Oikopleura dioica TaxID=34765 RepID=A0ABN7SX51_OIKDI|nr:Oidioi.mRNA.OKI2018_I69.chr1.g2332.t1.cds [Oikopleura dioica]